jgi:hypothetical protein
MSLWLVAGHEVVNLSSPVLYLLDGEIQFSPPCSDPNALLWWMLRTKKNRKSVSLCAVNPRRQQLRVLSICFRQSPTVDQDFSQKTAASFTATTNWDPVSSRAVDSNSRPWAVRSHEHESVWFARYGSKVTRPASFLIKPTAHLLVPRSPRFGVFFLF